MSEENWWQEETLATCGHDDVLGYLSNTSCKKCADRGHKESTYGN